MLRIAGLSDYTMLSILPYIDIDWSSDTKERNSKVCINFGWLFWEIYIDVA